ncbi:uncharacterized protein LOC129718952 isoform X2 [Wyeomyia smithii]|uniref:uncharacterized protein LOC129718952 isoform X2 n=1 Tax=Wyeomyia smithii TaxID=174621 RepID=UPI0024681829|nr:uncharacterized protein LOC129718952 isoform X2 [Wyeomyia smithii]XP_055526184.1 uncharacterized protein LOC129718952 isoform X2 [Wyeomyia smithii]
MALPINETTMKIVPSAKLINFIKTYICRDPLHSESIRDFVYDMSKINEKPVEVQNFSSYQQKPNEKKIMGKESLTFKTAYLKERSNNLNDRELQVFGFEVLVLNDLKWLQRVVTQLRKQNNELPYLHELIRDCKIALPKNEIIERNPELEARCIKLRCEQEAKEYKAMTRNVDNIQNYIPQDSIAYQTKQINRQLIAVGQFIFSVIAGFAFGFIGIELIVGQLDFGFRLLLGIIIALIIALAEIYFLAKKLNEDYSITSSLSKTVDGSKRKVETEEFIHRNDTLHNKKSHQD